MKRYDTKRHQDGSWSVRDTENGPLQVAFFAGFISGAERLACELCAELNREAVETHEEHVKAATEAAPYVLKLTAEQTAAIRANMEEYKRMWDARLVVEHKDAAMGDADKSQSSAALGMKVISDFVVDKMKAGFSEATTLEEASHFFRSRRAYWADERVRSIAVEAINRWRLSQHKDAIPPPAGFTPVPDVPMVLTDKIPLGDSGLSICWYNSAPKKAQHPNKGERCCQKHAPSIAMFQDGWEKLGKDCGR